MCSGNQILVVWLSSKCPYSQKYTSPMFRWLVFCFNGGGRGGVVVIGWGGEDSGGGCGGCGGGSRGGRDSIDDDFGCLGACAALMWELFFYRIFCFSSL